MRATGIVRRIDELGRVVIPKEIRRTLRIREGDPLEIYTDRDGEVILKKTQQMLPALTQAGVVDAGGRGLLYIYMGYAAVLRGEELPSDDEAEGVEGLWLAVSVIMAASGSALVVPVLADVHHAGPEEATLTALVSNGLSLFSLSFFIWVMRLLGHI